MNRKLVSDVALIYGLFKEYASAMDDGDFERWLDLWIDDGIQMPQGLPIRLGKEMIRKAMEPTFARCKKRCLAIEAEEIRVLGQLAYSYGFITWEWQGKSGGEITTVTGKFLDILEKQVDGSWKIAIDCQSNNEPKGCEIGESVLS